MANIKIPDHWTTHQAIEVAELLLEVVSAIYDKYAPAIIAAERRRDADPCDGAFADDDIPF